MPANHDACTIANSLVVTARDKCSNSNVTAGSSMTCNVTPNPAIAVTRNCPATPVSPGGAFNFTGTVRNGGNVTLSNVTVTVNRPAAGTVVYTAASLAPGASASFSGSYTAPWMNARDRHVTVTATDRCGNSEQQR